MTELRERPDRRQAATQRAIARDAYAAVLRWLDALLHREILRLRARGRLSQDELRGLYIGDAHVDALLRSDTSGGSTPDLATLDATAATWSDRMESRLARLRRWERLVRAYDLSPVERRVVLVAFAPDLDLRYETLFAYLNDDATRKWPTRDLVLRLLAADAPHAPAQTRPPRLRTRTTLDDTGTLIRTGILQALPAQEATSWLATGLRLAPLARAFLTGRSRREAPTISHTRGDVDEDAIQNLASGTLDAATRFALRQLRARFSDGLHPLVILEGRPGAGRTLAARRLARAGRHVCLLRLDAPAALEPEALHATLRDIALHQRLCGSTLHVVARDDWWSTEGRPADAACRLVGRLAELPGPVAIAVSPDDAWPALVAGVHAVPVRMGMPDRDARLALWRTHVGRSRAVPDDTLAALADRFLLTPGQIAQAVRLAADARMLAEPGSVAEQAAHPPAPGSDPLFAAARELSRGPIGALATRVNTPFGWPDLVLPDATLRRLLEIAGAVRSRTVVYEQWGFARRVVAGQGLKVLFSGVSGTGKTMAASVIARELGVDLYVIDLSAIVSKYIGETEKNLARIFDAARTSNAILFFDEADALFGKRSEVKDAHDRYANVEIAYLLQRLEAHDGVVILATNLSRNIDAAFARRMHYVVEFPPPGEAERTRLWRGMFPDTTPLGEDVDFAFLARNFEITGGDIRNVALDAAFLAAQDGRVISMPVLLRAVARQLIKQGRTPSPAEFKQHYPLVARDR